MSNSFRVVLSVEADEELKDGDDIADALVGETIDVGVYSFTVIQARAASIGNAYELEAIR